MYLIVIVLLWTDPFRAVTATIPAVAWTQQKPLAEELGNAILNVFKGMTSKARPARAAAPLPGPVLNPSETEMQVQRSRLQGYANSLRVWVEQSCELNQVQRDELQKLLAKELESDVWWKSSAAAANERRMGNQMFGESFPVLFTLKDRGPAAKFHAGTLKRISAEILPEESRQRLQAAIAERDDFHRKAYRDYIISILDRELYLTSDQRKKLVEHLTSSNIKVEHGLYSFQPQTYYLPYRSMTELIGVSHALLGNEQRERLRDLYSEAGNRDQHVIFQSSEGVEAWYQHIENASIAQRNILLRSAAVRVAFYKAEIPLSIEQAAHLSLASKGAVELAVMEWKEATRLTVEQMEQQMAMQRGNFAFAAAKISGNDLDRQRVWAQSVDEILANEPAKSANARDKTNNLARATAVLTMLDQELWLRPEQRQPLLELIENAFPRRSNRPMDDGRDYFREVALFAQPLFRIPDEKINAILNESQQDVWKQLQSCFRAQPGRGYLLVPTRNGNVGIQLYE